MQQSNIDVRLRYYTKIKQRVVTAWKLQLERRNFPDDEASAAATRLTEKYNLDFRVIDNMMPLAATLARSYGDKITEEYIEKAIALQGDKPVVRKEGESKRPIDERSAGEDVGQREGDEGSDESFSEGSWETE
jgi:hypothetical protein